MWLKASKWLITDLPKFAVNITRKQSDRRCLYVLTDQTRFHTNYVQNGKIVSWCVSLCPQICHFAEKMAALYRCYAPQILKGKDLAAMTCRQPCVCTLRITDVKAAESFAAFGRLNGQTYGTAENFAGLVVGGCLWTAVTIMIWHLCHSSDKHGLILGIFWNLYRYPYTRVLAAFVGKMHAESGLCISLRASSPPTLVQIRSLLGLPSWPSVLRKTRSEASRMIRM
jgi:hypothetical protein